MTKFEFSKQELTGVADLPGLTIKAFEDEFDDWNEYSQDDNYSISEQILHFAQTATEIATDEKLDIIDIQAHFTYNLNSHGFFTNPEVDVIMNIKAFNEYNGLYDIQTYLSNVTELNANYSNKDDIKDNMRIRVYKEVATD